MRFVFSFDLARLDRFALGEPGAWPEQIRTGFRGTFTLGDDVAIRTIADAPLLWLGKALHELLTYPLLFGEEAFATVPGTGTVIRTRADAGQLAVSILDPGAPPATFAGPFLAVLRSFGTSYRQLIADLAVARGDIASFEAFMMELPDGFTLMFDVLRPFRSPRPRPMPAPPHADAIVFRFDLDRGALPAAETGSRDGWRGALYSLFEGDLDVSGSAERFEIGRVPLLETASLIHRLLFSAGLFDRAPDAPLPDRDVYLSTLLDRDTLVLAIDRLRTPGRHAFAGRFDEVLASFGGSYRRLVEDLADARPDIVGNDAFMAMLPHGVRLAQSYFARTGRSPPPASGENEGEEPGPVTLIGGGWVLYSSPASEARWQRVFTVVSRGPDGSPAAGVAHLRYRPHAYAAEMDDADRPTGRFLLMPIGTDLLRLFLDRWAIENRAAAPGSAPSPASGMSREDRERHAALTAAIGDRLRPVRERSAIAASAEFMSFPGSPGVFQVRWRGVNG